MLDQFQDTKLSDKPKSAPTTAATPQTQPSPSTANAAKEAEEPSVDEFAKHIQQSMADMLKELEQDPESMQQFEQLMKGFADPKEFDIGADDLKTENGEGATKSAEGAKSSAGAASSSSAAKNPDAAFQDTIKRTMERMKASSQSADSAASNPAEDDMMQALLKELAAQGDGADGDDTFSKMLLGMMEQLTNKEILYEPMRDLNGKFDGWLATNATGAKLSKEDEDRYREQRRLVKEIVTRFEQDGYSDANPQDREYIVERMQAVSACRALTHSVAGR